MTREKFSPSRIQSQKLVAKLSQKLSELGIFGVPRGQVSLKQQSMKLVRAAAALRANIGEPTAQEKFALDQQALNFLTKVSADF